MRKLAAFLGLAAAALSAKGKVTEESHEIPRMDMEMPSFTEKASFHGVQFSGDPRKAARNHHRRMKASGRHNWRNK